MPLRALISAFSAAALLLTLASCASTPSVKAQGVETMASLGDSITQASTTCDTLVNCPDNNWSTGSNTAINSQRLRIEKDQAITVGYYNDSVVGAKMADMQAQAQAAVSQHVSFITILAGANDYCAGSTDTMTSVQAYQQQITAALSTINAGLPQARIHVASLPDPLALYNALKDNARAQQVWAYTGTCRALLADPTDSSAAADARRQLVEQRAMDYNKTLSAACTAAINCHYDNGAVTAQKIKADDISSVDFFHPSLKGQTKLADTTWSKGGLQAFLSLPTSTSKG